MNWTFEVNADYKCTHAAAWAPSECQWTTPLDFSQPACQCRGELAFSLRQWAAARDNDPAPERLGAGAGPGSWRPLSGSG